MIDTTSGGSPAPAASSSSPADSSAASSAPAQTGDSSGASTGDGLSPASSGGAPGENQGSDSSSSSPASTRVKLPNMDTDPDGHMRALEALEGEDLDKYMAGEWDVLDGDPEGDAGKETAPAQDQPQVSADELAAGMSPEEFAKLPPKAQAIMQAAQQRLDILEDFAPLANPEARAELDALLDHPSVRQIIELRKRGENTLSFDKDAVFAAHSVDALLEEAGIKTDDLDFIVDAEQGKANLQKVVALALEKGIRAGELRKELAAQEQIQTAERKSFFQAGFDGLTSKIKALKSDLSIDDPNHPIAPFADHLHKAIASKEISFEYLKKYGLEGQFMAWQTSQKGGLQKVINAPVANQRLQILQRLEKETTNTAVNAATRKMSTSIPQSNERFGVDAERYLSDEKYQNQVIDGADSKLLHELDYLHRTGNWKK